MTLLLDLEPGPGLVELVLQRLLTLLVVND